MADDEYQHHSAQGNAGASDTYPMQCSALRKGKFVCIKGRPCRIVSMSTSKTGKHGHAKVHLVATDIFTNKKMEELCPSTHNMDCPNVENMEWLVLDISSDGFLTLLGDEEREDIKLPDGELGKNIQDAFNDKAEITVTSTEAMGEIHITDIKNVARS